MIIEFFLFAILFFLICLGLSVYYMGIKVYEKIVNFLPPGSSSHQGGDSVQPVFSWKYKFMLFKAYFDNGYSLLSYPKWALAIAGIGSAIQGYSLLWVIGGALGFGILSFVM